MYVCMYVCICVVICTTVVPCLSNGLGKNNKLCPCLSYFPSFLRHLEKLAFFKNGGTNLTPKQSNRMLLVNVSKVQQLSSNFSKSTAVSSRGMQDHFGEKSTNWLANWLSELSTSFPISSGQAQ